MRTFIRSLFLIAIRGLNTLSKFALTLYTAHYLGLADLGLYGLIVAVTTILPAFAGFGTNDWTLRQVAGGQSARTTALITTRLSMVVIFHIVCQPIAFAANAAFGTPVPWSLAIVIGVVAVLEHVAADTNDMLVFRNHAVLANLLFFLRAGVWPLGVIALGIAIPATRTINYLMYGWLAGLLLTFAILAGYAATHGHFQRMGFDWARMRTGIRASVPFYLKDMSIASGLYLDRFLVTLFLGIESAGVYTFFWSIANVIHNLCFYGIFQPHLAKLVQAASAGKQHFRRALLHVELLTVSFALAGAISLIFALPYLLPYLNRPLLSTHLMVFNIIVAATLLRLAADAYNYVLLALHHDRAIAIVNMAGVPISAGLYTLLIPLLGLEGAALSYLITGAFLFAPRWLLSRRYTMMTPATEAAHPSAG